MDSSGPAVERRLEWAYLAVTVVLGAAVVVGTSGTLLGPVESGAIAVILLLACAALALGATRWIPGLLFTLVPAVSVFNTRYGFFQAGGREEAGMGLSRGDRGPGSGGGRGDERHPARPGGIGRDRGHPPPGLRGPGARRHALDPGAPLHPRPRGLCLQHPVWILPGRRSRGGWNGPISR